MKLQFFSLAILLSVFLFSCSKDEDPTDVVVGSGTISGTIDGKSVDFKSVQGSALKDVLTFSGSNDDISVAFMMPKSIETDTYVYGEDDDFSGINGVIYTDSNGDDFGLMFGEDAGGTLTITKHDQSSNKIEGSFKGVLSNPNLKSVNISFTFSISYVEVN